LLLAAGDARAQHSTGNHYIIDCQHELRGRDPYAGSCLGIVGAIFYFHETLTKACVPQGVNWGQALRVVMGYMQRNPGRLHRQFPDLVVEAFEEAWPCRR
jgi:hypothetical protein